MKITLLLSTFALFAGLLSVNGHGQIQHARVPNRVPPPMAPVPNESMPPVYVEEGYPEENESPTQNLTPEETFIEVIKAGGVDGCELGSSSQHTITLMSLMGRKIDSYCPPKSEVVLVVGNYPEECIGLRIGKINDSKSIITGCFNDEGVEIASSIPGNCQTFTFVQPDPIGAVYQQAARFECKECSSLGTKRSFLGNTECYSRSLVQSIEGICSSGIPLINADTYQDFPFLDELKDSEPVGCVDNVSFEETCSALVNIGESTKCLTLPGDSPITDFNRCPDDQLLTGVYNLQPDGTGETFVCGNSNK